MDAKQDVEHPPRRRHILGMIRRGQSRAGSPSDIDRAEPESPRTTIGLALGGGAARGWAHIGVIDVLTRAGIQIDVIAGTSIGAVVGGCHACGKLAALNDWSRLLSRRRIFGLLDLSFSGGLVSGERIARLLELEIGDTTMESLPCAFAAIATELNTGHEMWLTRGRLLPAMRASYALPGIFPPVRIGGRWLVDGALVNPVPVSAARALGARLVIAVNLNTETLGGRGATIPGFGDDGTGGVEVIVRSSSRRRASMFGQDHITRRRLLETQTEVPGLPTVMIEAFNVMQDRIARSRMAGDPPDVLIGPKVSRVGMFDFHRAGEAIDAGREATERALPEIKAALEALA
jgi:NTE family protein